MSHGLGLLVSEAGFTRKASPKSPLRSVAKFNQKTDQPNSNGQHADGGQKPGCCRARAGYNPDSAGTDDAERNEIRQYRVAHAVALWTASRGRCRRSRRLAMRL